MKKLLLLSSLVLLGGVTSSAQIAQTFLGSNGPDQIAHVIRTPDGFVLATGSKTVFAKRRVWLLKLSQEGHLIWEKSYVQTKADVNGYGHHITLMEDGGMLITGTQGWITSPSSGSGLIIRVDAQGNLLWQKDYPEVDAFFDITPSGDNFMVAGWIDFTGSGHAGSVMLVDGKNGAIQWQDTVRVFNQTKVRRIFPTEDGNFLIVGRTNVIGAGFIGVFIRKITPSGVQLWQATHKTEWREANFSNNADYYNQSLGAALMPDGTLWIANPVGIHADIGMMRFSANGELMQQTNYGSASVRELPYGLTVLADGSFLVTGEATLHSSSSTKYMGMAMLVDHKGNEVWRHTYGADGVKNQLFNGVQFDNGHFMLAGVSDNPSGHGKTDGWLLHAEPDGNVLPWTVNGIVQFDFDSDCQAAAGAPPVKSWFIELSGSVNRLLVTDEMGKFKVKLDSGVNTFTLLIAEPAGTWQVCHASQTVASNSTNPQAQLVFLVQSADGGCPHTTVGIAQPDLARCSTGTFLVTVQNLGGGGSDELILDIIADPALSIVSVSEPYILQGNALQIDIPPMGRFQQKHIAITTRLSCDVQIGAAHGMVARLMPVDCAPIWNGPRFAIEGTCAGHSASFQMKNQGGGGANAASRYRVIADDLLLSDWTDIVLPQGGSPHYIDLPANGRTWRVELEQAAGFPSSSHPSAVIEGCGLDKNGLHSIGFRNAWRFDDGVPEIAAAFAPNTTGVPNAIAEGTPGFGYYNLVGDEPWLEYTARAQNHLQTDAQFVEFRFTFTKTLDTRTFHVLASNGSVHVELDNNDRLRVIMKDIQLPSGDFAMLRFRVKPAAGVQPDNGQASLFFVNAQAYFNGHGPLDLVPGFNNYSATFPLHTDPFNDYSEEILRFGGRGMDFGTFMALAPDGSVFLAGESDSYSNRTHTDGLLVKADPQGKAYWLNAIDLGDQGHNTFRGVMPLADGGCMVAGNHLPASASGHSPSRYIPYIARIGSNGQLLWHKHHWPSGAQFEAWVSGLAPAQDGSFIMYGYAQNNGGSDPFYTKYDENGDVIWQQYEEIPFSGFRPVASTRTADGGFVFLGTDQIPGLNADVFLQKIDANGNKIWSNAHKSTHGIKPRGLAPTPDGGFMASGYSQWLIAAGDYGITPTFIRYSSSGWVEWEKNPVLGPFHIAYSYDILPAPDGGYFSVGEVFADTVVRSDVMLLKLDENAEPVWWRHYGSRNTEWARTALLSTPDQLLLWGFNQRRPPLYDLQAILVRVDLNGDPSVSINQEYVPVQAEALVFPNPAYDRLQVSIRDAVANDLHWHLSNVMGSTVRSGVAGDSDFAIDLYGLPAGMYFLAFPQQGIRTQRVMIVH